jgi:Zn-dependent protease with chaperone function
MNFKTILCAAAIISMNCHAATWTRTAVNYFPAWIQTLGIVKTAQTIKQLEKYKNSDQSAHQTIIENLQKMIARHTQTPLRIIMVTDQELAQANAAFGCAYYSLLSQEHVIFVSLDCYASALAGNNLDLVEFIIAHEINHVKNKDCFSRSLAPVIAPALIAGCIRVAPRYKLITGLSASVGIGLLLKYWFYTQEVRADNEVAHDPKVLQAAHDYFERLHGMYEKSDPRYAAIPRLFMLAKGHIDLPGRVSALGKRLEHSNELVQAA